MKIYFKAIGYVSVIIIFVTLLLTVLHYFNLIGNNVVNITKLVIGIGSMVVGGYMVGKNAIKKGWLEGLKLSLMVILILLIISLIWNVNLSLKSILYYLILTISATAGSMFGISIKVKNKA